VSILISNLVIGNFEYLSYSVGLQFLAFLKGKIKKLTGKEYDEV